MIPEIEDSVFPTDQLEYLEYGKPNTRAVMHALQAIHSQLVVNAALLRELIGWAQNN